jgi:signal transduction histidine kinase/CheY-like chemotaxis protein
LKSGIEHAAFFYDIQFLSIPLTFVHLPAKNNMSRTLLHYIIFLLCWMPAISIAQDTDTVTDMVINHRDNIKSINDMNEVPSSFRRLSNDRARNLGEAELDAAQKLNAGKDIGDACNKLGLVYLRFKKPVKALEYFGNSLMWRKNLKDQKGMGVVFGNIGFSYSMLGKNDKAFEYFEASLKILKEEKYDLGLAIVNDFTGQAFYETKDYESAINYFKESQNIYHKTGNNKEEERLKKIIELIALKGKNAKAITLISSSQTDDSKGKDTVAKNKRNSDFFDIKHKKERSKEFKNIDQLSSETNLKPSQLSEEELLNKLHRDSIEMHRLKMEHDSNDINLSHYDDSIVDAKREEQIEMLQGKIAEVKKTLLEKQLDFSKAAQQRIWLLLGAVVFVLVSLVFYIRYRTKKKDFIALEQAHKELQQTRDKLIEAEQFKDQFLANMSHEIRTPMNAIIGASNLVLNTNLDDQQLKYMKAVKQSSENLLVIINDILDLSKIKAGKMEFESIPFHIKDVVEGVITTMRFKAEEKALTLQSNISSDVPFMLVGDQVRLSQVLLNLVSNAIKFTSKGTIRIDCKLKGMANDKAEIEFAVTDTGIGIPEDKYGKIFESFSQASADTTRLYGGTGLGLTISKQLVSLQGGTINVGSKVNVGTTFTVVIPFLIYDGVDKQNKSTQSNDLSANKLKNLRILLAEDNEMNQMIAIDTLESLIEGITIDVAFNGRIAVEKLQENNYDLILMDVQMPEMNGYEATQFIREEMPYPHNKIKIMAMTASATKPEIDKCFSVGMDSYISKPFDPEDLLKKITSLLNNES